MNYLTLFALSSVCVIVLGRNVFFGQKLQGHEPVVRERFDYYAIPWRKRVKYYFYNDSDERPIKSIICYDYQKTDASVNITAGGLGYPFVNLRFKSQRSFGLEYVIEIYV